MDNVPGIPVSPLFSRCTMETVIAHLEATASVRTVDYTGCPQATGGDPVRAEVLDDRGEKVEVKVEDRGDGAYDLRFTAHRPSTYCLKVSVYVPFLKKIMPDSSFPEYTRSQQDRQ